ncbi:hypothetical protein [Mycobacterium asiaticum]|uniref:hypothetical protein n=1 Tax=Mycobacterium asiaticum TaxID=1790 RepID=UPI0012DB76F8|nr:hypothetical protein [Mycobacterium asiaticum]
MSHSVPAISRAQAISNRQSAASRAFWLFMLTAFGAVTAAVGISFAVVDPSAAPAWIASLIGVGCAVAGFVGCRRVMPRVRYRITTVFSGLRLVAVLGCVVLAIWGLGAAHLISGRVAKSVIIAAVLGALVFHLSTSTLFMGDCNGLLFRKTLVHWDSVAQVVYTVGAGAGTVEIGARLRPGVNIKAMPVRDGQVLVDLPVRTVVSRSKFDVDRMRWVLNQSGRQDIALVQLP